MISHLASPSVCVIDDEEDDYAPILNALMTLGLGCVHVRGRNGDPLPPEPFDALRIVFTDLHLSGQVGKVAASHTANVVKKVVSPDSGPVLIVIWSKYAADTAGDTNLPPEDQPTEADLFRSELLSAEPKFKARAVFLEMAKPKLPDRPKVDEWIATLQGEIQRVLSTVGAFEILWVWESLARDAGIKVSELMIQLSEAATSGDAAIESQLRLLLRVLAHQQGGPDISEATSVRYLLTVFSQIGLDMLQIEAFAASLQAHALWLAPTLADGDQAKFAAAKLNVALLTSPAVLAAAVFIPGTVYDIIDSDAFARVTGFRLENLQGDCFEGKDKKGPDFQAFKEQTKPIVLEITPSCDYHQGHRRCVTLLAGLVYPVALHRKAKSKDSCKRTPVLEDRRSVPAQDIGFVFSARYRFTVALDLHPAWLQPRIRLKDILLADICNWHSNQSSRIGYLSF